MIKELTCIICPKGCNIKIEINDKKIEKIEGNTCKRGYDYAVSEITNPVRTLTTTVRLKNGEMLSVKTDKPIPKDMILECMKEINKAIIKPPIKQGQIIIKNILNLNCNIIATKVI